MKKTVSYATSIRGKAALCCGVAILLTACGGATDDIDRQQSLAATTASEPMEAPGAVDAGLEAPASAAQETTAPDTATQAADSAAPAGGGSAPVANEFNLSGYQDAPAAAPSDAAVQGTTDASSADGQQAPQLPAA